jgi:hypothetical protein
LATLVDAGIKSNEELFAVSEMGDTPLAILVQGLDHSADIPRDLSPVEPFEAVIKLLQTIPVKDQRLFQSKHPVLHTAAWLGSLELTKTLLEMGATVCLNCEGASLLHFLHVEAGRPFLAYGRDLCHDLPLQNSQGKTPLESIVAARFKRPGGAIPAFVYEELLCTATKASKDVKGRDLWERVCADLIPRFAMTMGSRSPVIIQLVDELISHGVLEDHESHSGASGVKALLNGLAGADTVPVWLASILCQILQNTKYKKSLTEGQNVITCLKWATRINNIELVKLMLQHGASVHEEAFNISALQAACLSSTCNMAMFNLLFSHADTNKLNKLGKQGIGLVHLLLQKEVNHRELRLKALLEKGADPNLCSAMGVPPLVMFLMEDYNKCVDILLEFGADVSVRNADGMDIALAAATRGNVAVLEKLHNHETIKVDWAATCVYRYNGKQLLHFYSHFVVYQEWSTSSSQSLPRISSCSLIQMYRKCSFQSM